MEGRDWGGVSELLADDLVVEWPVSAERIVGRENFVRINAEYPEGWAIRVLRIVADGELVISEVEVPHEAIGLHRVVSFWTVRDGRITDGREYWTEVGGDPSPEWRAAYVEPLPSQP
jgi:ketosteroid isomerase-like protein